MGLEEEIKNLISLKQEGAYWDFKREWYSDKQKTDLLHDIICFANNLVNRDCYIIIGVDEEKEFSINDVTTDSNRKNTQKLVDFLKNKKFAGNIRPIVMVREILIYNKNIDIIIIKNSHHTPYYLTEKYQGVHPNNIYTRIFDTNTALDMSADVNHIEYLWKKHLGLIETPLQRLKLYLQSPNDWLTSPLETADEKFYQYAPEFRLVTEQDEHRNGYEYYLFSQTNPRPHWGLLFMHYHQTVLETFQIMAMDGGRWIATPPERASICPPKVYDYNSKIHYGYYILGSMRYILLDFLGGADKAPNDYMDYINLLLIFHSKEEKLNFEQYVLDNLDEFNELMSIQKIYMNYSSECDSKPYEKDYKTGLVLNKMLTAFKNIIIKICSYQINK